MAGSKPSLALPSIRLVFNLVSSVQGRIVSNTWKTEPPILSSAKQPVEELESDVEPQLVASLVEPQASTASVSSIELHHELSQTSTFSTSVNLSSDHVDDEPVVAMIKSDAECVEPLVSAALVESEAPVTVRRSRRWYAWPFWGLGRCWDLLSLAVLLAVVAAVPLLQFASLGYILFAAGRLANGEPWRTAFPGLRTAGKLGTFAMLAAISWIPVYVLTDLAYSAQLLQPASQSARMWRLGAFMFAAAWVIHVGWAAMRGGRWWHFLWPAPLKFLFTIWRPAHWSQSADRLYDLATKLHLLKLWWLGARAFAGALLWTCVPVSLMIIGLRAQNAPIAPLVGLIGAIAMIVVMLYLPLLQVHMAAKNRFTEIFNVVAIRQSFMRAPWFCTISLFVLCGLAIPLYLLRIEPAPSELVWAPSLVFVALMLPAKLLIGAALGYANKREKRRHWASRWPAWMFTVASVAIYVGALYIAQFVAWQGAYVMYFQHAVLVPAPLISV